MSVSSGKGAARPGTAMGPKLSMPCAGPRHAWGFSAIGTRTSLPHRCAQRLAASSAESAQPEDPWASSPPPTGQVPDEEPRDELARLFWHTKRFFMYVPDSQNVSYVPLKNLIPRPCPASQEPNPVSHWIRPLLRLLAGLDPRILPPPLVRRAPPRPDGPGGGGGVLCGGGDGGRLGRPAAAAPGRRGDPATVRIGLHCRHQFSSME